MVSHKEAVLVVIKLVDMFQGLSEALEMDHFPLTQESQGLGYPRVIG